MRKLFILLVVIFVACLFGDGNATERSKVLVVELETKQTGSWVTEDAQDATRRKIAAAFEILSNRGVDYFYYKWDGDTTKLKTHTYYASDSVTIQGYVDSYDAAIFVGGYPYKINEYTEPESRGGGLIYKFLIPDTNYSKLESWWWFGHGANDSGSNSYDLGVTNIDANSNVLYSAWYTCGYTGELDSLYIYTPNDRTRSSWGVPDLTNSDMDSVLTATGWLATSGEDHYLGVWTLTSDGLTNSYNSFNDGTINLVLDAWLCKHCDNFTRLQWALNMDNFGMHQQSSSSRTTFPNSPNPITHENFFAEMDSLFQTIIKYDMKLSIGCVAKYVRDTTCYGDTNQWSEWWDLVQKYKDNNHFQWVSHNHGYENPDDRCCTTFYTQNSYTDFPGASETDYPTVAEIDSLYQVEVDSIEAWGVWVPNHFIPPAWKNHGYYGHIADTLAKFYGNRNITTVGKDSYAYPYHCSQKRMGGKILKASCLTYSSSSSVPPTKLQKCMYLWQRVYAPLWFKSGQDGHNPGVYDVGDVYDSGAMLDNKYYTGEHSHIITLHTSPSLYTVGYNESENRAYIKELAQTLAYLEWLAGKDLYECVFAQDIDWEQVQ